eukprot:TRINITY_DN10667_c0_g1_i1.p1 TRINITY_DN10667_c0_g1~~TRINITY_DN10667_c0_g1_i1.p1  ORF type:complete len:650 (+),score=80.68 TRINITY_DN10667_c0_g1_i1:243-1952(+)
MIDDYREAYWWLRDHTPEDARVMAWWDYGYQITGIANRTTIADGNTWNHEHIALLGLCLSSPVEEAHIIARHMADYVLVWAGANKDDVGKSSHMARIANSVYKGHCSEDDCDSYGIYPDGRPSKMMGSALIYSITGRSHTDERYFKEVYYSRNKRVRIMQILDVSEESRRWGLDPKNRICDAPGSWYCPGHYPPALRQLLAAATEGQASPPGSEAETYQGLYKARLLERVAERPPANEPGLPEGSYLGSCRGCSFDRARHLLRCSHCRSPGTPSLSSELDLTTCPLPEVNNIRGSLQCEPKPNAPDIPPGGYADSCKGCEMRRGAEVSLFCSHCSTADGRQIASSFALVRCPAPGKLDNQDGLLTCKGVPNSADVPTGPYLGSCQGCHLIENGRVVSCSLCRSASGRQLVAQHEVSGCQSPGSLDNQDGLLVCVGGAQGGSVGTPDGPYKSSCSDCSIVGDSMLACKHCRDKDGRQHTTSYDASRCVAPASLHNENGMLTCQGVPNGPDLPEGGYLGSCQGCYLRKGVLGCSHCRSTSGQQLESLLLMSECSAKGAEIQNSDGTLWCSV